MPTHSWLTRRQVIPLLGASAIVAASPHTLAAAGQAPPRTPARGTGRLVYVGTYTAPGVPPGGTHPSTAVGIYAFRMRPHTGDLVPLPARTVTASNPSYLALDPSLTHLYCANEDQEGQLSAFRINPATGGLTLLNTVPANGAHTTHVSVHPSGRYLFAANYTSGNYPVHQLRPDGSIGRLTDTFQGIGNGTGPNAARQEAPHAHQILSRTDGGVNYVFGVDLGADRINVSTLDLATGRLRPNTVPFANLASGAGPRHMAFHPRRAVAYVLDELVSTITGVRYDPARGSFIWLQTISTLPESFTGQNTTAEIRVHPNGRFLYCTNRGHNSIAMYRIDPATGTLHLIGFESTRGEWPRGMNLDPTGAFLYAANQNTDTIAVFRIDLATGRLRPTALVPTPTPVDIAFGPA